MSNLKLKHQPRNFDQAAAILGTRDQISIGHNTALRRGADGEIFATYHGNEIVEYQPSGVHASWAGWTTQTTSNRLNMLTDARFNIKNRTAHVNGEPVDSSDWIKVSN